jgi:translation initiation factor 2 beta subunit (eIF-2beta)/eIF-5
MKNVHLIPTDKPTRLRLDDGELVLGNSKLCQNTLNYQYQNIYITNDEEIKEGDWVLSLTDDESYLEVYKYDGTTYLGEDKKIILTTDQDLIKDGIQPIDDEFLEWFVKNPSCESVELEATTFPNEEGIPHCYDGYKIIIPQEEPKQDYSGVHFKHCYQGEYEDGCKYGEDDCPAKPRPFVNTMPMFYIVKQETLEQTAKSKAFEFKVDYKPFETDLDYGEYAEYGFEKGFIDGAKWQAERMYSEEEVKSFLDRYRSQFRMDKNINIKQSDFIQWFEQFKNK